MGNDGPGHRLALKTPALSILSNLLLVPLQAAQGVHVDPAEAPPPDMSLWPKPQRDAWRSAAMALFRDGILLPGLDVRGSVLDDLSGFYGLAPEVCRERCLHWEDWSVQEWKAGARSSPEEIRAFYNSVQSWSFDLMWYAYLQVTGHCFPATVTAARFAVARCEGRRHLDFGSGVGLTSQVFRRLGFETTLADVSRPLLNFARWRLERRGEAAGYLDLNDDAVPEGAFDCITALDTLVHVPDFERSVGELHRALSPDGWLLANFDVRAKDSDASAWHLHGNAVDLDRRLQACGFARERTLGAITHCYRRVEPGTARHAVRRLGNAAAAPLRMAATAAARVRWPTPARAAKLVYRLATGRRIVTNGAFHRP